MPNSCVAYNCANRVKKESNTSFLSFPMTDETRLKQWIVAMKRENYVPKKDHRLCSEHFTEDCFFKGYSKRRRLKPDAVPSIFQFPEHLLKELSPLGKRPTMETDCKESNDVSTPTAVSEPDIATPILASILLSAKKKNSKQIVTGYILFASEVRRFIIAANPGRSFGYISRLIGARWHNLPLHCKTYYRKRAQLQNKEEAQSRLMSKRTPQFPAGSTQASTKHTPAGTSDCFDASFLAREIVIREEPIDNSEDPTPSRLDHEFILPCTDSYQSYSTPAIKEVFTVVKTEPVKEPQQITSNCRTTNSNQRQTSETAAKYTLELSPLMNRPTMENNNEESNDVSTPMAMSEQDVDTPILASTKKKNSKRIVTGYILFARDVRKSILAANSDISFANIGRLIGAKWRNLPLLRKTDYRERARQLNEEMQSQSMSEGTPQSSAETSDGFDSSFLVREIDIKQEPIDNNDDPIPSRLDHEFILPCTDLYQSCSTPTIKEVFTVVKTEPVEELQQITSNCRTTKPNKRQTSETADVAKEINTNGRTTKPDSRKTAEKDNTVELSENRPSDEDAATSITNSSKDSFDVFGEYIAAKLRNLDLKSCAYVQKAVTNILFDAEMGKFK